MRHVRSVVCALKRPLLWATVTVGVVETLVFDVPAVAMAADPGRWERVNPIGEPKWLVGVGIVGAFVVMVLISLLVKRRDRGNN